MYWKNLLHFRTMWRVVGPKPKHLYKFHSVNDYLFEMLAESSLWACKADELNDPYDCEYEMSREYFKGAYLDKINFAEMGFNGHSEGDEKKIFEIIGEVVEPQALQAMQRLYKSGVGVCCFTSNPKSELMWSHYASAGKGVCLQFGFGNNREFEKRIVRVKYDDKPVRVVNKIDQFHALFTKRKAWAYEKEWRILNSPGKLSFQSQDLKGIIFGPQFDAKKYMTSLLDVCKKSHPHLQFSICEYTKEGLQIKSLD